MTIKTAARFTALTFAIMLLTWGSCVVLAQLGVTADRRPWIYALFMAGGFSPTIASYIVLKRNKLVGGFKEWLKSIFDPRAHIGAYLFAVGVLAALIIASILTMGLREAQPFYMFFALLPLMVIGGGLEEAGWRYVLQPVLDKKYGYILSSLIVAPIWAVWHLPLFFIPGMGQYGTDFGFFSISVLALTFIMGAVSRLSGKVFPCILAHSMVNAATAVWITNQTLTGNLAVSAIVIALCVAAVFASKHIKRKD